MPLRSLRAGWREAASEELGHADPRGVPALRQALAEYLGRVRGVASDPEQMLICRGFSDGFSLLCRWLRGVERVALEDPGWHRHRLIVEGAGLGVVPIPVDEAGLRVDVLQASEAEVVLVTCAHQFPTGALLGSDRRSQLVDWAERHEGLIVEDDYDSEYRYDRGSVGALQGLAPERVAYVGSASHRLVPAIGLGWMQLPSWMAWPLIQAEAIAGGGADTSGQLALRDFIERGELDRHIRRTRLLYQRRREAQLEALAKWLPCARPGEANAGLFELVALPEGCDEAAVIAAAKGRGIGLEGLGHHSFTVAARPALLMGFAGLSESAITRGVHLLSEAIEEAS